MKGTLHKTEQGWYVSHATYVMTSKRWTAGKYPLHPDDVKQINRDAQVFDNIEARIAAYPDVEFDWCVIVQPDGKGKEYAKLLNH
jgi:hypothetical protein